VKETTSFQSKRILRRRSNIKKRSITQLLLNQWPEISNRLISQLTGAALSKLQEGFGCEDGIEVDTSSIKGM
jgi:hypothetical protein